MSECCDIENGEREGALTGKPLVSVKMPTYNHASYIEKAIECVLAQKTTFPFELVIGEDCSTDGTREIVFDYAKRYPEIIHVVYSDENVGMHKNSKRTNAALRGKYIAYCEGDDYWQREDKLQLQVDYLESHPECGLVHSDHDRYYAEIDKTISRFYEVTNNQPPAEPNLVVGWGALYNILTCTAMARLELVNKILRETKLYQDDEYIGGYDYPLFIELSMLSKVHYINESLSTYTVQSESASNIKDYRKKAYFIKSNIEGGLEVARKYNQTEDIEYLESKWNRMQYWISFWEQNPELANQARANDHDFSIKDKILYVGAVNKAAHHLIRVIYEVSDKLKSLSGYGLKKYYTQ